jgi:hypothetical protein
MTHSTGEQRIMKKLLFTLLSSVLLTTTIAISSTAANATAQQDVKDYIEVYVEMLQHVKDHQSSNANYLISGDYNDLNGAQLTAAIEVLQLVVDGDLDTCCWTGNSDGTLGNAPNVYGGMPSVSGADLMNLSINTQYNYTRYNGNSSWLSTGTATKSDYIAMKELLDIANNIPYYSPWMTTNAKKMKYYEHKLGNNLIDIWEILKWGFSYADSDLYNDSDLQFDFRARYAFACVVCFGAGFYDTSLLHNLTDDTSGKLIDAVATSEYTTVFNKLSSTTRAWMNGTNKQDDKQYPNSVDWNGKAPLQVSTGPTIQTSLASTRGNRNSDKHIYPTHCHGSTELYKVLNPMRIIERRGTAAQRTDSIAALPYTLNNSDDPYSYISHFDTVTFVKNMYTTWLNRNNAGPYFDSFEWTGQVANGIGTMFYNGERDYHSMHNGRWIQFTQWSRLTSPAEGTYFPKHTAPNINIYPDDAGGANNCLSN